MMPRLGAVLLMLAVLAAPLPAAAQEFAGDLDPVPHDFSDRDDVVGMGTVSATLSGTTLTITGNFTGLSSPATNAHLKMGLAKGVPGATIGELNTTHAAKGEISGSVRLNSAQIAALKKGALYIQLDSVKGADGNSWAWLEGAERPST
ncbi:MAG TPA: CHRD domain-containing protein [Rhizomicrobium sp.]|nr:CHRD domain-containing protein [Rhizomicrobium sp.]